MTKVKIDEDEFLTAALAAAPKEYINELKWEEAIVEHWRLNKMKEIKVMLANSNLKPAQ